MNIDSIENGYVIDHLPSGTAMTVYSVLNLQKLGCQVALITNAKSGKFGVKDIIKINELVDLNFDKITYIAKDATVNVIKDGKRIEKRHLELPEELINVVKCKNPKCICNNEDVNHVFKLNDEKTTYRCIYCETKAE